MIRRGYYLLSLSVVFAVLVRVALFQFASGIAYLESLVGVTQTSGSIYQVKEILFSVRTATGLSVFSPTLQPAALLLSALLSGVSQPPVAVEAAYVCGDVMTGAAIAWVAWSLKWRHLEDKAGREDCSLLFLKVLTIYLLNPLTLSGCVTLSFSVVQQLLLTLALVAALHSALWLTAGSLALLVFCDWSLVVLALPLGLVLAQRNSQSQVSVADVVKGISAVLSVTGVLLAVLLGFAGYCMGNQWRAVGQMFARAVSFGDLTPNWGFYWYFFVEIFDEFRGIWVVVFQLHRVAYAAPLLCRLWTIPHSGTVVYGLVVAVWYYLCPDPNHGLLAYTTTLLWVTTPPGTLQGLRWGVVLPVAWLGCAVIGTVYHHCWLETGTGNVNYFYMVTLVYLAVEGLALVQVVVHIMREYGLIVDPEDEEEEDKETVPKTEPPT